MTAYESRPETVLLGFEMGGDERKDLRRDAVYANEGVPLPTDGHQCACYTPVEATNLIEGETISKSAYCLPQR